MANRARGEASLELGGQHLALSLGLGALAELEDTFGVEAFEDVFTQVFEKLSAKKMLKFLTAILKGNGVEITPDMRKAVMTISPDEFTEFVRRLMGNSGLEDKPADAQEGDASPLAVASAGSSG